MSASPTIARQMARTALGFDLAGLGPAPRAKAAVCLADYLSCLYEARDLPWSLQAKALVTPIPEACTIIASEIRASAMEAAFANAVMAHGLVREDMHAASNSHHGVVVWSVLLALAETIPVTGQQLIDAALVAYEAGARFGRLLFDKELARLFRPTGLNAPIGAALGGARLLGLSEDQTVSALSLAANQAGGLNQWPHSGSSDMYFHPGFAARSALTALALAQAGAVASPDIIEGEAGMFASFARRPPPRTITLFPEGQADILNVYHKPAPACNYAQTASQCAVALIARTGLHPHQIASVTIRVSDAALTYPGCNAKGPFERALQAKMSIIFATAAVLVYGHIAEDNYHDLDHPEIKRLAAATTLVSDEHFTAAFPGKQGTSLTITLTSGERLDRTLDDVIPASPAEIRQRLEAVVSQTAGADTSKAMLALLEDPDAIIDMRLLMALCRTGSGGDHDQPR